MAGTVTFAETIHTTVKKILWDWLSTAAGAADKATTLPYDGLLERAAFIPDGGGTQPTDLYDVTITDPDSLDVLNGLGANLSNAAPGGQGHSDGVRAGGG